MPRTRRAFGTLAALVAVTASGAGAAHASASARSVPPPPGLAGRVDTFLHSQVDRNGLPGLAVGVVAGGRVVHVRGFGTADSDGRAVTPDTPFVLASVSKPITATAVLQLVDAGRVRLDDPVRHYLPDFRLADSAASRAVTVRQLLTHTSGLPPTACEHDGPDLDAFVHWLRTVRPEATPGTHYDYCSGNYNVLGLLVERVSGEPYATYLREHVFGPLGMSHSYGSLPAARAAGARVAQGHRWVFGVLRPLRHDNPAGAPSGYLVSSAHDLSRFALAQLDGGSLAGRRVLSPATVAAMQRPAVNAGDGTSYGLGWQQGRMGGVPVVYHLGADYDMETMVALEPTTGRAVVVLVNAQGLLATSAFRSIEAGLVRIVAGEDPQPSGMSVPSLYGLVDALLVVVTALLLLPLLRMRRWARIVAPARRERRQGRRVVVRVTAEVVLPLAALVAATLLVVHPLGASWQQMFLLVPDLVGWLWASSAAVVAGALARAVVAVTVWRRSQPRISSRDGELSDAAL